LGGTNDYSTNYVTTNAVFVWSVLISNTTPGTNFTYTFAGLDDTHCTAESTNLNSIRVVVNGTPTADVFTLGPKTICNGAQAQIQAELGGIPPWTVLWSDGGSNYVTATPFTRTVTVVNPLPNAAVTNYYSVTNLSDSSPATTSSSNDLSGLIALKVDPTPAAPPASLGDQFSCYGLPATLGVTVPAGFTADWYSDSTGTNLLLSASTTLTTNLLASSLVATQTFWAAARFNDPLLTNYCRSAALTNVSLISTNCPPDISIFSGSNGAGTLQWYGNWILQGTTNLSLGAAGWRDLTGPTNFGPRIYSWSNPPPIQFFRLYAPTN
jgi:hypothetical protein